MLRRSPSIGVAGPWLAALLLLIATAGTAAAQTYRDVQSGRIESLPHEMTPEEELIRDLIGRDARTTPPPSAQPVRHLAEFERQQGVLVRYPLGISTALVAEMSEEALIYCVVTTSQQSSAYNAFAGGGVNMSNVVWVNGSSDTYWTRDYGPWFIYDDNGDLAIIDTIYNRPRPNDDAVPGLVANRMGLDLYGPNLIHTGGNWMADGHGVAVSTTLVWEENPGLTHAQIDAMVDDYLGIHTYHVVADVNGEYIKHVDCWGKFLSVDQILIRQVPTSHSQYDEIEAAVDYFESQTSSYGWPYRVVRVYTPNNEPYTNSLILNDKVLVPITGSAWDDDAIAAYQAAMPGYEVLGFTGSWASTDALHCRTIGIGDPGLLYVFSRPLQDTGETSMPYRVAAEIIDYSQSGLIADQLRVYWRSGGSGPFDYEVMNAVAGTDSFYADIPAQPAGTQVQYYVQAADNSGRQESWPLVGAAGPFGFRVISPITIATGEHPDTDDTVGPYLIESTVVANRAIDEVELAYRVNGGGFQWVAMSPAGGNLYRGWIPGQAYTSLIEYYVRATDTADNEVLDPPSAPAETFDFYVAPRVQLLAADMEGGSSWTHAPATTGWVDQWHLSTQRNHTAGGTTSWKCGDTGGAAYASHMDAALLTSVFELGLASRLTFWHHVAAETSAAYAGRAYDGGLVEIYAGGRWQAISPVGGYPFTIRGTSGPFAEGTGVYSGSYGWHEAEFDLTAFEGPAQLRFRFGSDASTGLEGWFIDDVLLDGLQLDPQGIEPAAPADLARLEHWPSLVREETRIRFTLERESAARLAVFDAQGRLVRQLHDGPLGAGEHALAWDRTDGAGRRVAPGVYFYRLDAAGRETRDRMVVVR